MPYIQLKDGIKLWYRTNIEVVHGSLSWNANKPTILLMHGNYLTVFLDRQFEDPVLNIAFNLIAFDVRSTGETQNPPDPRRDTWMDAADLMQAMLLLGSPPFHVFTPGGQMPHLYALRLALLWPNLVKTIMFVEAGARPEDCSLMKVTEDTQIEVMKDVIAYDDLDTIEWISHQVAILLFGSGVPDNIVDRVVEHLEVHYTGRNVPRNYDYIMPMLHEPSLDKALLKLLTQPVLYIRSECTTETRPDIAIRPEDLTNAQVSAEMIRSPPQPHTREPWSSHINESLKEFVMSHWQHNKVSCEGTLGNVYAHMAAGLNRLAQITNRPELLKRDPMVSASFSLTSDRIIERRREIFAELIALSETTEPGNILDADGRPLRKWSDRHVGANYCLLKPSKPAGPLCLTYSEVIESHVDQ